MVCKTYAKKKKKWFHFLVLRSGIQEKGTPSANSGLASNINCQTEYSFWQDSTYPVLCHTRDLLDCKEREWSIMQKLSSAMDDCNLSMLQETVEKCSCRAFLWWNYELNTDRSAMKEKYNVFRRSGRSIN